MEAVAQVERTSRVYETAAVGPPQPDYLNAAALVTYEGEAAALLEELLGIERGLGRVRGERWGPRTIDLDLLWAADLTVRTPTLELPHPRLAERAFALVPMLDVAPDARDPRTGSPYARPPGEVRPTAWLLGG